MYLLWGGDTTEPIRDPSYHWDRIPFPEWNIPDQVCLHFYL